MIENRLFVYGLLRGGVTMIRLLPDRAAKTRFAPSTANS